MKSRMRGGSPAYNYHMTEGFLNQESIPVNDIGITQLESGPVENYANLYQISGGARNSRKRCGVPKRRNSKKIKKRCGSKRNTRKRNRLRKRKRLSLKRYKPKCCGCKPTK